MQLSLLEGIVNNIKRGSRGVLCIIIEQQGSTPRGEGAAMFIHPDGSIDDTVGGGPMEYECIKTALDMMATGDRVRVVDFNLGEGLNASACPEGAVCGGQSRVYFEQLIPAEEIFIFGAGHVGKALARVADAAGYSVTVWDERPEFANSDNIPWGKVITCPLAELFDEKTHPGVLHENSYVAVATRGHNLDSDVMKLLAGRQVPYIGVIGSRGKIAFVDKQLMSQGVSKEYLQGLHRPIGLPIRAETPEEIAVSILAEIIAVRRGANIRALKEAK